ncbi:hypothetical protein AXF42_Ash014471 [Apostasia shenzhenica]|uniref:Uncharacterized protein n=1 Tax=Apostasia shenzhenica TaxID=1088818 RepID=A0A2H9ZWN7_9ASPA|nr:hypothetical protein AXF42_Ash014471 [Apostasia shenzhenica]
MPLLSQTAYINSLVVSKELRESLIQALFDPEPFEALPSSIRKEERGCPFSAASLNNIFSNEDMLLGTVEHN